MQLSFSWQVAKHRLVTDAVHAAGGKIALQILHAGRYAYHPLSVAPSSLKSPITPFRPRALTRWGIRKNIGDYRALRAARTARGLRRRRDHGLRGLSHQPVHRAADQPSRRRMGRVVSQPHPLCRSKSCAARARRSGRTSSSSIACRCSTSSRVAAPGTRWSRWRRRWKRRAPRSSIPASAGTRRASRRSRPWFRGPRLRGSRDGCKTAVKIPLITTNRINDPATAEAVLARGDADMVSMARPFLADAEFVNKAAQDRADEINTCIGCNQACLDQIFQRKTATCLVNPYACRETELKLVHRQQTGSRSRSSAPGRPAWPARRPQPSAATP